MRLGQWLLVIAITLVLAAIVHFGIVLAVPYTSPQDAWARLQDVIRDEGVAILPAAQPGEEILPQLDPNVVYGVCRFDVRDGPFAVSAEMPPAYWSIAFHTPNGVIFYAIDDEAAVDGSLDIELRNPEAMRRYQLAATADEADRVLAVGSPSRSGYVLMRALVSRGASRGELEAMMRDTYCGPIEEAVAPEQPSEPEGPRLPFPPQRPDDLP